MTFYHAVLIDETGCEFGADTDAIDKATAWEWFRENYPESRVVQVESSEDTHAREKAVYDHIARGGDYDDEGRPIYHYPDYDDDEEE